MNSPASDAPGLRTITIAHYVHQHGGAGHYNPIFQRDESELGLEDMDTVDDEEDPDSGSNEQGKNSEPAVISLSGDIEEAKNQDYRHNRGANERAAVTIESKTGPQQLPTVEVPLVASVITDIEEGSNEGEHPNGRREANGKDVGVGLLRSTTSTTRTTEGPQHPDPTHDSWATPARHGLLKRRRKQLR
jgi:hypothetical protein